ncbi:hypothetical protein FVE85_0929 [Porphyridium purpureum]|uniref:Uncharacterized protein n=1 Tax=Porphyridium purpureum TaxID=35688 RepID=A0A5J4Z1P7_PORPP|nr:hypothetical protein FVE85_0929 [Porphyridium purpureum]|eukprot:POR3354..scf208_2
MMLGKPKSFARPRASIAWAGTIVFVCVCGFLVTLVRSAPLPENGAESPSGGITWRNAASRIAALLGIKTIHGYGSEEFGPLVAPMAALPRSAAHASFYAKDLSVIGGVADMYTRRAVETAPRKHLLDDDPPRKTREMTVQRKWQPIDFDGVIAAAPRRRLLAEPITNGSNETGSRSQPRREIETGSVMSPARSLAGWAERPQSMQIQSAPPRSEATLLVNPWLILMSCLVLGNTGGVVLQALSLRAQIRRDSEILKSADICSFPTSSVGYA